MISDDELRQMWRGAGGEFHGPITETGTMPEARLLPFLRVLAGTRLTDPDKTALQIAQECVAGIKLTLHMQDAGQDIRGNVEIDIRTFDKQMAAISQNARVEPSEFDVRRIMVDVVPGDGSGQEVYAKSVAEVEELLTKFRDEADANAADALRWRKLVSAERIRILGTARLGQPDAHIGLEVWGVYPGDVHDGAPTLTTFVDGLQAPR